MSIHTVYQFRAPGLRVASASNSNSFFAPASVVSIGDSTDFSPAMQCRAEEFESSETNPDGLGLARGVRTAVLLQACMVLMGYGIWHLCHLAH